jgi:hypothetical protein
MQAWGYSTLALIVALAAAPFIALAARRPIWAAGAAR